MSTRPTSTAPVQRHPVNRGAGRSSRRRSRIAHERGGGANRTRLGRYTDANGHVREVIARPGAAGSVLVIDRECSTRGDRRLVAHLAADEPPENAAVVCRRYLQDAAEDRRRCRRMTSEDERTAPFADRQERGPRAQHVAFDAQLIEVCGCRYRLELVAGDMSIPELRWCRCGSGHVPTGSEPVSVRDVIAALEDYEPASALTAAAISMHAGADAVSTTVIRAELARVQVSPIVLNRRLREVTLEAIDRQQLSMSEIAIRCGRIKRDRNGNESGETSWLARRLGILPEGGHSKPTPWIHSDVLGLIARCGLGVSPREVELG
jgi:hypothetical protein